MTGRKIHIIVKYFYPVAAGIETNILETYSVLAEKGWDITVHTSKDSAVKKNVFPQEEEYRNIKIKRYQFNRYGFIPEMNWQETDIVALHNFDVFPHLSILFYCLGLKLLGRKQFALVLTPHGGFNPEWAVFGKIKGFIKQTYHYTLGTWLINTVVDAVRTVSEWEKKEMLSKGIRKNIITVITNGIEKEAYENVDMLATEGIKKDVRKYGRYILQIGRIYMIKNYETTIKALVNLPKEVKYVIAGAPDKNPSYKKNNYMSELKKLISSSGLKNRVIFAGVVRGIDKYYLIKHAQMMVHMAMWESYCNVVHEGMSQGLPCIVANNTALPLLIKNNVNGYVVDTFDSETLGKKINYILKNRHTGKIKNMSVINKNLTLKNSWRAVAEKVNILYSNLIKKYDNERSVTGRLIKPKFVKIYLSR